MTFLFTDIEGSTPLLQTLGEKYADVLAAQRRILRETLTGAGGREIDTQGDAFFYSFTRARDAVAGAVAAQRALAKHPWPDDGQVRVRMGLHTGEPSVGDEGYVGLDVVRAARICSAGHGGQILLSGTTRALLGSDVPDGAALRDLGTQTLKDVGEEHVFQLSVDGDADFAPLKSQPAVGFSAASILGDDFHQRIKDFAQRAIAGSLEPPPAPPAPKPKPKRFWSRFRRR